MLKLVMTPIFFAVVPPGAKATRLPIETSALKALENHWLNESWTG